MISVGNIVESTHGRDKGNFYIVIRKDNQFAYLCNGKSKKLNNLKKKNLKHLKFIATHEDLDFKNLHDCDIIATVKIFKKDRENLGGIN